MEQKRLLKKMPYRIKEMSSFIVLKIGNIVIAKIVMI
jgi:hypothetical protein